MNVISPEKITAFRTFMQEHDFFYIIGHKEPDGDCIASCLGLKAIAEHYKKPYQLLSAGPFKRIEIQKYEPYFTNEMTFLSEIIKKNDHGRSQDKNNSYGSGPVHDCNGKDNNKGSDNIGK